MQYSDDRAFAEYTGDGNSKTYSMEMDRNGMFYILLFGVGVGGIGYRFCHQKLAKWNIELKFCKYFTKTFSPPQHSEASDIFTTGPNPFKGSFGSAVQFKFSAPLPSGARWPEVGG